MSKVTIAAGFAAGYVLGARAGRQRYEQLMSSARTFVSNPKVQETTGTLQNQAGDFMAKAKDKVTDKVNSRRAASATDGDLYSTNSYDVVEIPEARVTTTTQGTDNSSI